MEEMEKINVDKNLRYQYLMREKAANDAVTLRNYYTNEGLKKGLKIRYPDYTDEEICKLL